MIFDWADQTRSCSLSIKAMTTVLVKDYADWSWRALRITEATAACSRPPIASLIACFHWVGCQGDQASCSTIVWGPWCTALLPEARARQHGGQFVRAEGSYSEHRLSLSQPFAYFEACWSLNHSPLDLGASYCLWARSSSSARRDWSRAFWFWQAWRWARMIYRELAGMKSCQRSCFSVSYSLPFYLKSIAPSAISSWSWSEAQSHWCTPGGGGCPWDCQQGASAISKTASESVSSSMETRTTCSSTKSTHPRHPSETTDSRDLAIYLTFV